MFPSNGQINMDSTFGRKIFDIAQLENIKNIFEVGSWNGQGSTVCIMNAIVTKDDTILYSLEADKFMYDNSIIFWNNYNTKNKLKLLNGTLHNKIVDLKYLNHIYNNNIPVYNEHYIPEKKIIETTKIINIDIIDTIDFIILDGGEYTTQGDYDLLITKKPKYIALDDVNVYKCKYIRESLLNNKEWELFSENLNERNGWSIFQKTKTDNKVNL